MFDFLIHSPVAHYARTMPEHPALSFKGDELSYGELDSASNRLGNALVSHGLEPGGRVGIFMHKSLELGVAIYGALKAGGVFVPLDPFLPAERLRFILDDCNIEHIVSANAMSASLKELPESYKGRIYGVDADIGAVKSTSWNQVEEYPDTQPDVWIIDQDLGYIMYTSGSTGHPKGMMHTHHGSISYARWGARHVDLTPDDRVASHAPLHFDLSIFDFFSTAQSGATVVLVPEPVTKFAASWSQYIEDERISVVFTVPFTLIEMLERGVMEQRDLSSLRWILFGGEPFPPKHLRTLMERLPEVRFTNVYGPAEAPSCTCYDLPQYSQLSDEPVPIGTVSVNSEDLIIDDDDQECAVGEPGELCIRSSTLTKGYWNRPDLNERVYFFRDSFGPFPDVYFRTGDMVVRHEDGLLRFLGRKDRMVKTRGNRVELDEVEAALATHASVSEAAAFAVPDDQGSKKIVAAVKLSDDESVATAALTRHASTRLPGYALPQQLFIVDEFPRTSSGKIDRNELVSQLVSSDDS
ncbi:MAG: amino acid adenylation domain-containing protein [Woeseiaceae bacterium]|nr:amino acid adenylation domain-containing protein [Woeseiaceae bacterium]